MTIQINVVWEDYAVPYECVKYTIKESGSSTYLYLYGSDKTLRKENLKSIVNITDAKSVHFEHEE